MSVEYFRDKHDFKVFMSRDFEFRNSKGKVKPAPVFAGQGPVEVADTHAHLAMLHDPALALARAAHYGFGFIMNITNPADDAAEAYAKFAAWQAEAREILAGWGEAERELPLVRFACGVHPHDAKEWERVEGQLREHLFEPLTSCIGEIGLDYHYDFSPRPKQREVFARQLQLAHELGLPVALHVREAHDDAYEILRSEGCPEAGTLLHCFNLDAETLQPFLDLGCHVAFGGPLTFKKSVETRAALPNVPLTRLLTETDAPFMAPDPLRGTHCTPDHTLFTLRCVLDCLAGGEGEGEPAHPALTEQQICQQLLANALDLLNQPR